MPRPCKLTFDLESGVPVTCVVGYFCANFSLLSSVIDLRPMYATDRRQTDRRQTRIIDASALWERGITILRTILSRAHTSAEVVDRSKILTVKQTPCKTYG